VPDCLRCQRAKKPCPGIYDGPFLIHTLRDEKSTGSLATEQESENTRTVLSYQPSQYHFKQDFLLHHFISSFSGSAIGDLHHNSWMMYLFDYTPDSGAVSYAIRAATLALYGTGNRDLNILHEADQWNLAAIQAQRVSLAGNAAKCKTSHHITSTKDICTSMMLLYYELIRPSAIGSWLGHLRGLSQMIFLLGPQECQSDAPHLFFRVLRLLMVRNPTLLPRCFSLKVLILRFVDSNLTHPNRYITPYGR
jgi:hypothetical protein